MEIYLDNSATTKVFPEVAELMTRIMCEDYGNSSSLHTKGMEAESYLRYARETLAHILKVQEKELIFTSGGTESDNLALIGAAQANHRKGRHLITTQIEHSAVLQTMRHLETIGYRVTYLPVDSGGCIRLEDLHRAIGPDTILVSIMHTNNEIGSVQPIVEAGELIKRVNPYTLFHVDAVQGFGKSYFFPKKMNIDLLSMSGHKIHGPKGVGLLYVGDKVKLQPQSYGGGQQQNLRSGTENVPGAAGMAKAAQLLYASLPEEVAVLYQLKSAFIEGVRRIEGVRINGLLSGRPLGEGTAPHVISISVPGVRSEVLLHALEDKGIYVSAGSACSARKAQPSAVLKALGMPKDLQESTIRVSLSVFTTMGEINYTLHTMYDMIPVLRKYTSK
ncbi:MAG: cysteine desulfurase [Clostridium sp.]|nr:cysteine desulfurase [Clostridium sp.]